MDILRSHLKWKYPVINEPKCFCFSFWGWIILNFNFLHSLKSASSKVTKSVCNYQYPHVALVRLLFFVSIHSYYRDQRRIDCHLVMLYKVTYDLVAIPVSDYLTPNRGQSRHIHSLAYRQIPTLKNHNKYTFFPRTIIHWNALPAFIPLLPTLAQFSNAVCQLVHLSPLVSDSVFIF